MRSMRVIGLLCALLPRPDGGRTWVSVWDMVFRPHRVG